MRAWLNLIRYKNLIIIGLLQFLLRYGLLIPILEHYNINPLLSHFRFALLVIATLCFAAGGYAINDYFDIKIDLINKPQRVLVSRQIKRREALLLHLILTFIGLFIGLFLAYVARKETYILIFLFIPILLWFYSTNLKKHFFIGNLTVSFLTALVPYMVVSLEFAILSHKLGPQIIQTEACATAWFWTTGFAFFAFATNLVREIIKDIEDSKGDQTNGCRTLPIALGLRYTKALTIMLTISSIAALWAVYFYIPQLNQSKVTLVYFIVLLSVPYLILMWLIKKGQSPSEFRKASTVSKLIMVFGILYILVAGSFFN